ncbi:MAG TPA: 16S rRNA (adenine(1518)-N(6)/adenine(1519)-N(6))-dimethyltransferase RsmA [Phycisphaerae bacterium]|nr:16S rRNA (adenine(1518)-N(6)/adenine(1519)-N(6))-dimethyltransferase RsmA [Phycisphaerae bacterium]
MQTKRDIQALLNSAGIRPLKRFGQHFLIDGNLMRKLLAAADVRRSDVVLEVGPGTGSLTEGLLERAGHVVAVEIDRTLQTICRDRFGDRPNFTLVAGDVLERKNALSPAVCEALRARRRELCGRLLLVANLPYQVATPLIINLLACDPGVDRMCFTVQAEVADRLSADPGCKDYGPVGILVRAQADLQRIARVPPEAFWPAPGVDSAIVRLTVRSEAAPPGQLRKLAELVHGCFSHRRKTLRWSLRKMLDDASLNKVESDGRWDLSLRPEDMAVGQWLQLAALLLE